MPPLIPASHSATSSTITTTAANSSSGALVASLLILTIIIASVFLLICIVALSTSIVLNVRRTRRRRLRRQRCQNVNVDEDQVPLPLYRDEAPRDQGLEAQGTGPVVYVDEPPPPEYVEVEVGIEGEAGLVERRMVGGQTETGVQSEKVEIGVGERVVFFAVGM